MFKDHAVCTIRFFFEFIDFENRLKSTGFERSNHRSPFKFSRLHHIGIKTILSVTPMTPIRSRLVSFRHCWNEITAITRMLSRFVSRYNHIRNRTIFRIFWRCRNFRPIVKVSCAICPIFLTDKLAVLDAIWTLVPTNHWR